MQRGGEGEQKHGGVHEERVDQRRVFLQRKDPNPRDGDSERREAAQNADLEIEHEDARL